jgi:threonine dehydratase
MLGEEFQLTEGHLASAEAAVSSIALRTPVVPSKTRDGLWFKAESLQLTGSFKIRTAVNQLAALTAADRQRGIVTSSSGNFAQGVACAASRLGISAVVVMMRSSNPLKVERTRAWGAEVVFCEDRFEARAETVERIVVGQGRIPVHPYNHPLAVWGNATLGSELLAQLPRIEHLVVPVSGGGLLAGVLCAAVLRLPKSRVRIWGVQPEGSNAAVLSFREGRIRRIPRAATMADGLMVTQPGSLTFPLIQKYAAGVVAVSEEAITRATRSLFLEEKLVVEPSGAVSLAAILEGRVPAANTACVLSGGNISPETLGRILAESTPPSDPPQNRPPGSPPSP